MLSNSMPIFLVIFMVVILSNGNKWRLSGPATLSDAKTDADHMISGSADRRFPGVESCGQTLTGLSVTPLAARIDASLPSVFFCERKEPDQPPGNAQHGMQYGRKWTRSVYIRFVSISRISYSVSFLSMNVLIGGRCLRDGSTRAIEDQPDYSFKRPCDQGIHHHGDHG